MFTERCQKLAMTLVMAGATFGGVSTTEVAGQDSDALVESVAEAYGGREALLQVEAVRLRATMESATNGVDATIIRITEGPSRLKVMIHYPSRVEIRVVEGPHGWRGASPETLTEARGPLYASMALQAARSSIPWILLDHPIDAMTPVEDGVVALEVEVSEGLRLRALVDTESHRVVASESMMRAGPMDMVFRTEYSDFREFEGVLFPFHEENYASGTHTASVQIETLEINPAPNDRKLPIGPGPESGGISTP